MNCTASSMLVAEHLA